MSNDKNRTSHIIFSNNKTELLQSAVDAGGNVIRGQHTVINELLGDPSFLGPCRSILTGTTVRKVYRYILSQVRDCLPRVQVWPPIRSMGEEFQRHTWTRRMASTGLPPSKPRLLQISSSWASLTAFQAFSRLSFQTQSSGPFVLFFILFCSLETWVPKYPRLNSMFKSKSKLHICIQSVLPLSPRQCKLCLLR